MIKTSHTKRWKYLEQYSFANSAFSLYFVHNSLKKVADIARNKLNISMRSKVRGHDGNITVDKISLIVIVNIISSECIIKV